MTPSMLGGALCALGTLAVALSLLTQMLAQPLRVPWLVFAHGFVLAWIGFLTLAALPVVLLLLLPRPS